jgi:OCT family organic cation transporter-like MFS transporter 4/5
MALRFFTGLASMASTVVSFVLVVELVDGKWRTIMGILNILPVALAYVVCAGISWLTYNWRTMQFAITSPMLALVMLWYYYPGMVLSNLLFPYYYNMVFYYINSESPRWLLAQKRIDELAKQIELAANWNNRVLPSDFEKSLHTTKSETQRTVSITDIFQKGYKLTTSLMLIIWFTIILIYFGEELTEFN